MKKYDSQKDTVAHIMRVRKLLFMAREEIMRRGIEHDKSKLCPAEKAGFDEYTPLLKELTYGSKEYLKVFDKLEEVHEHHYEHNSHHPEHYGADGMNGFDLFDLIEMFFDWCAATERHADGNITRSIIYNTSRFQMPPMLANILHNTSKRNYSDWKNADKK